MDDNKIISLARECGTYQNGDMVIMSNEGLLYFTKMIVAESVVPLQKRINALESLVDELEEDLEAAEDRYRSIT